MWVNLHTYICASSYTYIYILHLLILCITWHLIAAVTIDPVAGEPKALELPDLQEGRQVLKDLGVVAGEVAVQPHLGGIGVERLGFV